MHLLRKLAVFPFLALASVLLFCAPATPVRAEDLPEFRPALLTRSRRSLVNQIDAEGLMKRGQGNAIVMFSCGISTNGDAYGMQVYRESPHSEMLREELLGKYQRAYYEPAVFQHHRTNVWIDGTVSFAVVNGKPHLRIFLNQEEDALTTGKDFIAPQYAIVPGNTKFKGFFWPTGAPGHAGVASLTLEIDETGHVVSGKIAYEHPPGLGFGAAALGPVVDALFIPGFRNGKPVRCRTDWPLIYSGPGRQMSTG
ncbi:MAG: energy transducer TonB [Chthoniobacterales bacterium]